MATDGADHPVLEGFSPAVREWFAASFPRPTQPQVQAWPHIRAGEHTLVCAPTGSGKTLTAFLSAIDGLVSRPDDTKGVKVLYISPLRALAFDVEKNLRSPLMGIRLAAERLGLPFREPSVSMRTGDTPARERAQLARRPADLLITTPESLYLMLTSEVGKTLATVAGAAGGGYAGNRVQKHVQDNNTYQTTERQCRTVYDNRTRTIGYQVRYRLKGKEGTVRMDHDPGRQIPVRDGELVLVRAKGTTSA